MSAQEGKRIELTSFGKKKIVISHYHNVLENQDESLDLVKKSIEEMQGDNWNDVLGLVQDRDFSNVMKQEFYEMLK